MFFYLWNWNWYRNARWSRLAGPQPLTTKSFTFLLWLFVWLFTFIVFTKLMGPLSALLVMYVSWALFMRFVYKLAKVGFIISGSPLDMVLGQLGWSGLAFPGFLFFALIGWAVSYV